MPSTALALPDLEKSPVLAEALSGRAGINRDPAPGQLSATTDSEAIVAWLASYEVENTRASHRREAERLWLWSTRQRGKAVSSLTHEDLLAYLRFLSDPQPAEIWVSEGGPKLPRTHPDWRPFYRPARKARFDASGVEFREPVLSPGSLRQARTILNSMFSWLVEAGYLRGNPLSLSRKRGRRKPAQVQRYLPPGMWRPLLEFVEAMPRGTRVELRRYHRARWLVSLFFLAGLRISEAASGTMGAFESRRAHDGQLQWWLAIDGKGDKLRRIPAISELMSELSAYRQSFELPALPSPGEKTPLVIRYGPANRQEAFEHMTRSALHVALKQVLEGAAIRLASLGQAEQAVELRRASAHWLRHTAGSSMADNQIDLRIVRDHLGHDSIATTNIYLHTDDDLRYRELEARFRVGWPSAPKLGDGS